MRTLKSAQPSEVRDSSKFLCCPVVGGGRGLQQGVQATTMATTKAEEALKLESKFALLKFSSPLFHLQSNPALRRDTRLIRTPHYYEQFALSLGKESPYIFSKVNPLNTDTSLLRTVCCVPGERKSLHFL